MSLRGGGLRPWLVGGAIGLAVLLMLETGVRWSGTNQEYLEQLRQTRKNPLKFQAVMARHRGPRKKGRKQPGRLVDFPGKQISDPELFWVLQPGSLYHPDQLPAARKALQPGATERADRISSLGWRDREVPSVKGPDSVRVFCIGGSTTFGLGVYQEQTYSARLQEFLLQQEPDRSWEVYNAGTTGYSTYQRVQSFRLKVLPHEPDMVVALLGGNDIAAARRIADEDFARLIRPGRANKLREIALEHCQSYTLIHRLLLSWRSRSADPARTVPRVNLAQFQQYVGYLVEECRARRVGLILVAPVDRREGRNDNVTWLVEAEDSLETPLIDLEEVCRGVEDCVGDRVHLSPRGHELLARELAELILSGRH